MASPSSRPRAEQLGATATSEEGLDSLRGAIGTPDQIRAFLRAYEAAGVDQVIFISQAGKNKHEDICESLELFAREVMPEFKEREPEIARRKAERLAPDGRALARRSSRRRPSCRAW